MFAQPITLSHHPQSSSLSTYLQPQQFYHYNSIASKPIMAIFNAARVLSILAVVSGAVQHANARAVEIRSEDLTLSHGATTQYHDQVYRLQQVGDGLFAGVREEDWDDNRMHNSPQ